MSHQKSDLIEKVETLTTITHIQADIINELFVLLSQHISAEELDNLPVVGKINEVAKLKS